MSTLSRPRNTPCRAGSARRRGVLTATAMLLALAAPQAALASGSQVVADCAQDGKLDRTYTAKDYADALKNIPTDVDEYTNCRDIIRRGQLGLAGRGKGSAGSGTAGTLPGGPRGGTPGGGATPGATTGTGLNAYAGALASATAKERAAVRRAAAGGGPVSIAGQDLRPDSLGHGDLGTLNSLPTPLVVVLLLLAAGAVAVAFPPVRSFVRTRVQRSA